MAYTDNQINEFLALAQEVGITRAKRELKYPNSWATAKRWADLRGIEIPVDELRARAASAREWYKDEDVLLLTEEGFNRVYEELTSNPSLTPDEQKKLAEAAQKYYNVWANVQGKATAINENRQSDPLDAHLQDLISAERAKNLLTKEDVTETLSNDHVA